MTYKHNKVGILRIINIGENNRNDWFAMLKLINKSMACDISKVALIFFHVKQHNF